MNILIPMAGAGKRFSDAGYTVSKPLIPTTYRKDGKKYPMVVCAVRDITDLTGDGYVIFINRTDDPCDIPEELGKYIPDASFIGVDRLTEGQACTCLLAKNLIDDDTPLFIGGCDNGMEADKVNFEKLSSDSDVLVFTYRNHDCVLRNPNAYGWVYTDENGVAKSVSVKKAISDNPLNDHAIVASFWFKKGSYFVENAEKMIAENDRINNEFYVDKVIDYCISSGLRVRVFEVDRYIGWGTPDDYECYEKTVEYWRGFVNSPAFLPQYS